jgi:Uma2 family endonuclease
MGDGGPQDWLLRYLLRVLEWLYHSKQWMITLNRNFYHEVIENSEKLIVPDIAVFKGINIPPEEIISWDMRGGDKECPPLIIEASSPSTYQSDIDADKKPRIYELMGVKEYFAYDPNRPVHFLLLRERNFVQLWLPFLQCGCTG